MKAILLAGLFATFNSFAIEYSCECYDTGLECDGQERMTVKLNGKKANFLTTDKDGDFPTNYATTYDSSYRPRTNKEMVRFINVREAAYSYFLVTKSMLEGSDTGIVKAPEQGHVWEFECFHTK